MGIIHSENYSIRKKLFNKIFIQKIWKLFIQKNYSFFWKIDYRPGLRCGLFPGKKSGQILGKDIEKNIVGKYWHKHHVGVARPDPGWGRTSTGDSSQISSSGQSWEKQILIFWENKRRLSTTPISTDHIHRAILQVSNDFFSFFKLKALV